MIISKGYRCHFTRDCSACSMRNLCISATGLSEPCKRAYLLKLRGYRPELNEAMIKGKEAHEKIQQGIDSLDDYTFLKLRKTLIEEKGKVMLKEAQVCSPYWGLRGFIDLLEIEFDGKNFYLRATEVKPRYWKHHIWQIMVYGLILSDPSMRIIFKEKGKRKEKILSRNFYPKTINYGVNIDLFFQYYVVPKITKVEFMRNTDTVDSVKSLVMATEKRIRDRRNLHKLGIYELENIPVSKECRGDKCYLYERFCSMVGAGLKVKDKQRYWGKKENIIKTKPKINLSEVDKKKLKEVKV